MCRAQSALPRPAPDEPNRLRRHHHRSRRHSLLTQRHRFGVMHRWRRSAAPSASGPHTTAVLALMTPRISGVGARLPTLTLAKVAAPNSFGDARIAADALSSVLRLKHDVSGVLPGGAAPGGRRRGRSSVLGCGRGLAGSVTICRVVVPEPASSAVWPAASSAGAPLGFNSMLRGGESSAAMAAKLKAMTESQMQSSIGTWGSLLWLGTASREARKASMLTVVSRRGSPPLQGEGSLKTSPGGRDLVARGRRGRS